MARIQYSLITWPPLPPLLDINAHAVNKIHCPMPDDDPQGGVALPAGRLKWLRQRGGGQVGHHHLPNQHHLHARHYHHVDENATQGGERQHWDWCVEYWVWLGGKSQPIVFSEDQSILISLTDTRFVFGFYATLCYVFICYPMLSANNHPASRWHWGSHLLHFSRYYVLKTSYNCQ